MHPIIVLGQEADKQLKYRFVKELEKLMKFLGKPQTILVGSRQYVLARLQEIAIEKRKEDIAVFYIGHGQENGWALDGYYDWQLAEYEKLSYVFTSHKGNLILVNACCFAGAAKKVMERRFGDYLLIAAMPEDKSGCASNFLSYVLNDWACRRNFFSGQSYDNGREFFPVVYGNEDLQKLFFPKIKQFSGVCL